MNKLLQPDTSPMLVDRSASELPLIRPKEKARTPSRRLPRGLLIIVLVALVGRLALLPWFDGIPPKTVDEFQFNQLAVSIVQRGEFAYTPGKSTSMRPPLYPTFVAGVYAVLYDKKSPVLAMQDLMSRQMRGEDAFDSVVKSAHSLR